MIMNIRMSRDEAEYSYNKSSRERERKRQEAEFDRTHITITKREYNRLLAIEQELKESKMTPDEVAYSRLKNPCETMWIIRNEIKECNKDVNPEYTCCGCSKKDCEKCKDETCEYTGEYIVD
jgi:hypothetical protein